METDTFPMRFVVKKGPQIHDCPLRKKKNIRLEKRYGESEHSEALKGMKGFPLKQEGDRYIETQKEYIKYEFVNLLPQMGLN